MNELHYSGSFHNSSLGWDYHHNSLNMDENATSFYPSQSQEYYDDFSSGYLEDAFIEFTSKRRRLLQPCSDNEQRKNNISITDDFQESLWKFNFDPIWNHEPEENLYCMNHIERISGLSVDEFPPIFNSVFAQHAIKRHEYINTWRSFIYDEEAPNIVVAETETAEEATLSESESPNSSSSSYKEPVSSKTIQVNLITTHPKVTPPGSGYEKRKKVRRVVYPFAMVKPGGKEGDVTLKEINERIQMPPTRPVKHPVGDFASSPHGSALSGKPVLALTTIHTFGRKGSITIIRTKG